MNDSHNKKKFLRVIADMRPQMQIMPIKIIYNENDYNIDSIIDIKSYVVPTLGEKCFAYYCKIKGKLKIIYLDYNYQWFVI